MLLVETSASSPRSLAPATSSDGHAGDTRPHRTKKFITPERLVDYLARAFEIDISPKTLANWRSGGKGPPYISIAGKVRYDIQDVARWLVKQKRGVVTPGEEP
jgi:hypothetical protein